MCTVTYIPTQSGFIFTSNRDEQAARKTKSPNYYLEEGISLFYPKDELAGGTWIGVSENKRLVCLLNGGFVYHNPKLKFPKSRGVVVKQLLISTNVLKSMESLNLEGVAPFTLVVVDWNDNNMVYELVWCKEKKTINRLNSNEPKIWSSSTLYTAEMKSLREQWFKQKDLHLPEVLENDILSFHKDETLGNKEITLKMKRDVVETVSTTMVVKNNLSLNMKYLDYVKSQELEYANIFTLLKV